MEHVWWTEDFHLVFEAGLLLLLLPHCILQACKLLRVPSPFPHLTVGALGLQVSITTSGFSCGLWGIELKLVWQTDLPTEPLPQPLIPLRRWIGDCLTASSPPPRPHTHTFSFLSPCSCLTP